MRNSTKSLLTIIVGLILIFGNSYATFRISYNALERKYENSQRERKRIEELYDSTLIYFNRDEKEIRKYANRLAYTTDLLESITRCSYWRIIPSGCIGNLDLKQIMDNNRTGNF